MYKEKVLAGQSLYDFAIQVYGCPEGVFELLKDNDISIDQMLTAGQELNVKSVVPELNSRNKAIATVFKRENRKPNSGIFESSESDFEDIDFESIDYITS